MNSVKKVFSHRSHSGDESSDDGRHTSSTAATSNPTSPQTKTKEVNSIDANTGSRTTKVAENGVGRSADVHAKEGGLRHKQGHDVVANKQLDLNKGDVDQDVQHLAPVTHRVHERHEIEEVERQKDVDRHVHHVQHHTQPVLDSEHGSEQQHQKVAPVTEVREKHASTDKDAALLASVAGNHTDTYAEGALHRQVVDKGEKVRENVHHHIHNVVQPIIEKDTHEYHRIQTTIPTHVVSHEAPIVHESTHHKPVTKDEFLSGGGDLKNGVRSINEANLLNTGKCEREVDGVAEKLERDLGVRNTVTPSTTTTTNANTTV